MQAIDIVQQYHLFSQIMTVNQPEKEFPVQSLQGKNHAILTAYLANSEGDQLMNSVQNLNYITTICLNYCNLRVYIIYFKGILRINEHLFHHVEAYGGGR